MRFLLITAWKDLIRILRDPAALIAFVAMPVIITGLVSLVSGGGTASPHGTLLLVDQDKTFLSAILGGIFTRDPLGKMIQTEPMDYAAARKRIDAGSASALLVIPQGFMRAFLRNEPASVVLYTNPSQRIIPSIIQEQLSTVLDGAFYVQTLLGGDLAKYVEAPAGAVDLRIGSLMSSLSARLSPYLNPPLISIHSDVVERKEDKPVPLAVLFFPGMLLLAIFGLSQSLSEDIWRERSLGTLRRILTTRPAGVFLGGKIVSLLLLLAALTASGVAAAVFVIHAPANNVAVSIVWMAGSGVALYLIAVVIQISSSEQRAGVVLNAFVLFIFGMLGGTFFPFEMMPSWLAKIGRFTPNGWLLARFKEFLNDPFDWQRAAVEFAVLTAFIAIVSFFLSRRLRKWAI